MHWQSSNRFLMQRSTRKEHAKGSGSHITPELQENSTQIPGAMVCASFLNVLLTNEQHEKIPITEISALSLKLFVYFLSRPRHDSVLANACNLSGHTKLF